VVDLEAGMKAAVARAYAAAGLSLKDRDAESLARIYARWAAGSDDGVIERIERKLARSLGATSSLN
jgi:hypothetical protein